MLIRLNYTLRSYLSDLTLPNSKQTNFASTPPNTLADQNTGITLYKDTCTPSGTRLYNTRACVYSAHDAVHTDTHPNTGIGERRR